MRNLRWCLSVSFFKADCKLVNLSRMAFPRSWSCQDDCGIYYACVKKLQLTAQVCCLFYFLLHSRLFEGKIISVFLVVLLFFKWALKKPRRAFLGLVQLHQPCFPRNETFGVIFILHNRMTS